MPLKRNPETPLRQLQALLKMKRAELACHLGIEDEFLRDCQRSNKNSTLKNRFNASKALVLKFGVKAESTWNKSQLLDLQGGKFNLAWFFAWGATEEIVIDTPFSNRLIERIVRASELDFWWHKKYIYSNFLDESDVDYGNLKFYLEGGWYFYEQRRLIAEKMFKGCPPKRAYTEAELSEQDRILDLSETRTILFKAGRLPPEC